VNRGRESPGVQAQRLGQRSLGAFARNAILLSETLWLPLSATFRNLSTQNFHFKPIYTAAAKPVNRKNKRIVRFGLQIDELNTGS